MNNVFTPTRPSHSRPLSQDGLTSPQLHLGLTKLGNDPLSQFPLSAWHWLPSLVCCPRTLTLDVVLFKGGAGQDLLTENSDSLLITDIKTSRGRWSQEQVEDSSEQLLLYSHLASEISPAKKIMTRFLVLTKTKEPVIEEHVHEVEPGNVKRTLAGVERVWRAIEAGVFYPAPSTMNCASCGYRAACRAWGG
ncbi:MAG: PD-(D/E)XK nuclease family protein [Planctomycetota bacterium]